MDPATAEQLAIIAIAPMTKRNSHGLMVHVRRLQPLLLRCHAHHATTARWCCERESVWVRTVIEHQQPVWAAGCDQCRHTSSPCERLGATQSRRTSS